MHVRRSGKWKSLKTFEQILLFFAQKNGFLFFWEKQIQNIFFLFFLATRFHLAHINFRFHRNRCISHWSLVGKIPRKSYSDREHCIRNENLRSAIQWFNEIAWKVLRRWIPNFGTSISTICRDSKGKSLRNSISFETKKYWIWPLYGSGKDFRCEFRWHFGNHTFFQPYFILKLGRCQWWKHCTFV